jgi:hypothetical protein
MSLTARKLTRTSAAEYLAAENDGTWRHEFVNGAIYAMAGASARHNLIRGCLFATLYGRVGQGCRVFSGEMKLHIKDNADERYYYPDAHPGRHGAGAVPPSYRLAARVLSARQHRHVESVGLTVNVSQLYRDIRFEDPALSNP